MMARALITAADFKELPIPQGLIAWWLGTYASVPAGWEIADGQVSANDPAYTKPNLLDVFPKLDSTANISGGNSTHTHTVPNHTHPISGLASSMLWLHQSGDIKGLEDHTHASASSASATTTAASNEPAYIGAIPIVYCLAGDPQRGLLSIRDLAQLAVIPQNMIGICVGNVPDGWKLCDGSNGTPNLVGRFIRGIPTTSTMPGTLNAGTGAHSHDCSHNHTLGGASQCQMVAQDGDNKKFSPCNHTHNVGSYSGNTSSITVEPPYKTVKPIIHVNNFDGPLNQEDLPSNVLVSRGIVMLHVMESNPSGWSYCDGNAWEHGSPNGYGASKPDARARVIKHVAAGVNGGGTGGSDTHVHSDAPHGHTTVQQTDGWSSYQHTWSLNNIALFTHVHATNSTTWTSLTTQAKGNLPPYVEVAIVVRD